ncbi:MAG: hypothetical protein V4597_11575 [Pseudomonadota bacterium]
MHPEGRGRELLYEISFGRSGGKRASLVEAASYVSTGDFSNITGQILFNKIKEGYDDPTLLYPQLCTVVPTEFLNGERIPGVGGISPSMIEIVGEGKKYPTLGLNENWLDTRATVKHGAELGFTRESIVADRTGLLLKQGSDFGRAAGVVVEKEVIDVATASNSNNSYNRNGVSTNTYLTSGAYINDQTGNALDGSANEWRAIEKADLLFDAMISPDTGEPIGVPQSPGLLVPSALLKTAERIVHATAVQTVDLRAQATTIRTDGANPLGTRRPQILSNQYVKARTSSTSKWYYGDFKRAIYWMQVWAIETLAAASNDEVSFTQDIWSRTRVSYRGVGQMAEPRFLVRNDT